MGGVPAAAGQGALQLALDFDHAGATHDLGTWTLAPGSETTFTSGTALPRDQISSVDITLPNGTPILHLAT